VRLPNDTQRHAIYGKTGSGKTVAGLWALEKRSWDRMPWIIVDFKRDPTIARIPRLEEVDIDSKPPKQAGLYVVRPLPQSSDEVDDYLWKVWKRGRTGMMFDEGYMVGRFSKPFNAILTQGRSLRLPVITLSQRPSWLSPFLMSEADFHQVFYLQRPSDLKIIREWMPITRELRPDYTSHYYDVSRNKLTYLKPVPEEDEILNRFDLHMPRRTRLFRGITSQARRSRLFLT